MVTAFAFSIVLSALCFVFLDPLCRLLGSDDALLSYCREYMVPVLLSIPFAVFGMVFQLSFITVGRAGLGALLSVIGGVLNIVLDWLFMAVFHWGLMGAAIATSIGYAFPSVVGTGWFCINRKQATRWKKFPSPGKRWRAAWAAMPATGTTASVSRRMIWRRSGKRCWRRTSSSWLPPFIFIP